MSLIKWVDFKSLGDERGILVALEIGKEKELPFAIKRVYYTAEGVSRAYHAHRELKQIAICVAGVLGVTRSSDHKAKVGPMVPVRDVSGYTDCSKAKHVICWAGLHGNASGYFV